MGGACDDGNMGTCDDGNMGTCNDGNMGTCDDGNIGTENLFIKQHYRFSKRGCISHYLLEQPHPPMRLVGRCVCVHNFYIYRRGRGL